MNINENLLHQAAARFIKGHDINIDHAGIIRLGANQLHVGATNVVFPHGWSFAFGPNDFFIRKDGAQIAHFQKVGNQGKLHMHRIRTHPVNGNGISIGDRSQFVYENGNTYLLNNHGGNHAVSIAHYNNGRAAHTRARHYACCMDWFDYRLPHHYAPGIGSRV